MSGQGLSWREIVEELVYRTRTVESGQDTSSSKHLRKMTGISRLIGSYSLYNLFWEVRE